VRKNQLKCIDEQIHAGKHQDLKITFKRKSSPWLGCWQD